MDVLPALQPGALVATPWVEMKEFKQEMGEIKTLLIQALRLPPPGQP